MNKRIKPSANSLSLCLEAVRIDTVEVTETNTTSRRQTYDPEWTRLAMLLDPVYATSDTRAKVLWETILAGGSGFHQLNSRLGLYRRNEYSLFKDWVCFSLWVTASQCANRWDDISTALHQLDLLTEADDFGLFPAAAEVRLCDGAKGWYALRLERVGGHPDRLKYLESRWLSDITMTGQNIFVTSGGRLGKGPLSAKAGDSIWVIPGADVPFILREVTSGRYRLVGEAYVHGIMHGEAINADDVLFEDIELE
ncbi:MAG: hypothetical protein M1813_000715 [Trichoglossum hirsutum]|nr:MAG: hypothetical protein M1813_000715 [Trichoglossum hirsutum]